MCGRTRLAVPAEDLAEIFSAVLPAPVNDTANLNIAPTDAVLVLRRSQGGEREIVPMRWGLVPFYEEDFAHAKPLINARIETLATRPAFRNAFKKWRCLVLTDGFYEWSAAEGTKKRKVPHVIERPDSRALAMAGLWTRWHGKDGTTRESCTIITRAAAPPIDLLHDRMPVVLDEPDITEWLDPAADRAALERVLSHAVTTGWHIAPLERMPEPPNKRQLAMFG